jgi:hypothetical protein
MKNPTHLPQAVFDSVSHLLEPDWMALVIDYHVDETQSSLLGSYVTRSPEGLEEVGIVLPNDLDGLLRELRESLPDGDVRVFSRCKFRLSRDGAFEAQYSYEEVDWDALLVPDWNFPDVVKKRVVA